MEFRIYSLVSDADVYCICMAKFVCLFVIIYFHSNTRINISAKELWTSCVPEFT